MGKTVNVIKMTRLQWFRTFPEPYRTQALQNYDEHFIGRGLVESYHSAADALSAGFEWEDSPQGEDHWYEFHCKLQTNMTKQDPINNDIEDDYCSYQLVELLRKVNFNVPCKKYYVVKHKTLKTVCSDIGTVENSTFTYACPTLNVVKKWIATNYHIDIFVELEGSTAINRSPELVSPIKMFWLSNDELDMLVDSWLIKSNHPYTSRFEAVLFNVLTIIKSNKHERS